jgi:hypothetical protein
VHASDAFAKGPKKPNVYTEPLSWDLFHAVWDVRLREQSSATEKQEEEVRVRSLLALLVQKYKYCKKADLLREKQQEEVRVRSLLAVLVQKYKCCKKLTCCERSSANRRPSGRRR